MRLQFDAAREGLLVELAGIGRRPRRAARRCRSRAARRHGRDSPADDEDLTPALEAALDAALAAWRASADVNASPASGRPPDLPPSPGRLGSLRRRYHELGASNPFAAQEYAEVRARLETLDSQRTDLEAAIHSTRELIGTLNGAHRRQFRQTFAALEGAFARRFRQLFDGGEAELSLTAPEDLSTTGVEITARPPERSDSRWRCCPAVNGRSPPSRCCSPCWRFDRCRSVSWTRSMPRSMRPTSVASPRRCGNCRHDPVRGHHAQPRHDRGGRRALRRHRRRRRGQPRDLDAARRSGHKKPVAVPVMEAQAVTSQVAE